MKFFCALFVLFSLINPVFAYKDSAVLEESNFEVLAQSMKQREMGLLIMFHTEFCEYCELMDENILTPMEHSGEYRKRIFIRKIQINKPDLVYDFEGELIKASEMADSYDANFTPTLVFLNHLGEEKAQKIVGINSIDLFSATVDQRIDDLVKTIKKQP